VKTLDELSSFIALLKGKGFQSIGVAPMHPGRIHDFWNPRTGLNVAVSIDFGRFGHLSFSRVKGPEVTKPESGDQDVMQLTRAFLGEDPKGP